MAVWGRILLLAAVCGAIVAGCGGGDDSIPEESAQVLLDRLAEVERGLAEGNCDGPRGAQASAELLREQVGDGEQSRVPDDLDPEVRELLEEGASNLAQLVDEECARIAEREAREADEDEDEDDFEAQPEEVEPPVEPPESPDDDAGDDASQRPGGGGRGPGGGQGGSGGGQGGSGGGPGDGSGQDGGAGDDQDDSPSGGIGG